MHWLADAQEELRRSKIDGWLVYDFRGSNPAARKTLVPLLGGGVASRRAFLWVPAEGSPTLLVHAIELGNVPRGLPVTTRSYASRESMTEELRGMLAGAARVAMDYSPDGDNPYVGTVDAGTVERIRALGVEVVSSGDVSQTLEVWSAGQLEQHLQAAAVVLDAKDAAFAFLTQRCAAGQEVRETEVQAVIEEAFRAGGCIRDHAPNVSFGAHAADPHYEPGGANDAVLQPGEVVLIDLWAKLPDDEAPYADVTWMGVRGEPSQEVAGTFEAVKAARDAALTAIADAYGAGVWPEGRDIDAAARAELKRAGHGPAFIHRTGHSIGLRSAHGQAVHLDGFETSDARRLRPGLGVTIEPGAYYPGRYGVRSEINVYLAPDGPVATTDLQAELEVL